jgi:hypothetical protein
MSDVAGSSKEIVARMSAANAFESQATANLWLAQGMREIERLQSLLLAQTKLNAEMWNEGYSAGKAAQQAYSSAEPCVVVADSDGDHHCVTHGKFSSETTTPPPADCQWCESMRAEQERLRGELARASKPPGAEDDARDAARYRWLVRQVQDPDGHETGDAFTIAHDHPGEFERHMIKRLLKRAERRG